MQRGSSLFQCASCCLKLCGNLTGDGCIEGTADVAFQPLHKTSFAAQALKGEGELSEAIFRNVYGMEEGRRKQAEAMARYVQRELACFAMTDSDAVMSGKVKFSTEFLDGN